MAKQKRKGPAKAKAKAKAPKPEAADAAAARMFGFVFECAAEVVAHGEEHRPMLLAESTDGKTALLPLDGLDKNIIAQLHRMMAEREDVRAAALVMEAWMHVTKPGEEDSGIEKALESGNLNISDLPGKEEAIIINIRAGGRQFLAACKIDRASNKLERGELVENGKDGNVLSGRFFDSPKSSNKNLH
jgi:hypothetical protein